MSVLTYILDMIKIIFIDYEFTKSFVISVLRYVKNTYILKFLSKSFLESPDYVTLFLGSFYCFHVQFPLKLDYAYERKHVKPIVKPETFGKVSGFFGRSSDGAKGLF